MFLYYALLPFKVIYNMLTYLLVFFIKPIDDNTLGLNCIGFNQLYFSLDCNDVINGELQSIKRSFLQKTWGVTKYPDGQVDSPASELDILYASLGAIKDYEINEDLIFYEEAMCGIIDNEMTVKHFTEAHQGISLQPNWRTMGKQAITALCILNILAREGNSYAKTQFNKLMWHRCYFLFLLFPNLVQLEETVVGLSILSKSSSGLFSVFCKNMLANVNIASTKYSEFLKLLVARSL